MWVKVAYNQILDEVSLLNLENQVEHFAELKHI